LSAQADFLFQARVCPDHGLKFILEEISHCFPAGHHPKHVRRFPIDYVSEDICAHRAFAAPLGTLSGDLSDFGIVESILNCSLIRPAKRIIPTALGSSKETILCRPIANREKWLLMETFTDCRSQLGIKFS